MKNKAKVRFLRVTTKNSQTSVQPGGVQALQYPSRPFKKSCSTSKLVGIGCIITFLVIIVVSSAGSDSSVCDPGKLRSCGTGATCDPKTFKCIKCPRHQVASQNGRQCVPGCPTGHAWSEDRSRCILAPCGPGFKKSWDGTECLSDPCHDTDCGAASRCVRLTDTTYECRCEPGRSAKKPDATRSGDICHDPCPVAGCGVAGQCIRLTGTTYECRCEHGLSEKTPGATPSDICHALCDTGYTRSGKEGSECDACDVGYTTRSKDGSFDCDACATGYTGSAEDGSVCTPVPCETGYTRSEVGSECDTCDTGYTRAEGDGSGVCMPVCETGYTRSEAGSYECDACATGYTKSEDGSVCTPVPCETGYTRSEVGSECDTCDTGYTRAEDGSGVCMPVCKKGYTRSEAGSYECDACATGYTKSEDGSVCTPVPCETGYTRSEVGSECDTCDTGYTRAEGDGSVCMPVCETGYTRSEAGSFDCDACATGYTRSEDGSVCIPDMCGSGTLFGSHKISSRSGGLGMHLDASALLGRAVASVGDLNGDGTVDLAVGAPRQDSHHTITDAGAVGILFLNPDYTVLREIKIGVEAGSVLMTGELQGPLERGDLFGYALDSIGDLDGDGVEELVVGAFNDDDGGTDRGALYVLFLKKDGHVKKEQKISDLQGGLTIPLTKDDRFGIGVARVGDVDQDGVVDVAVAKSRYNGGEENVIEIYLLFLNSSDGTVKASQYFT